MNPLLLQAGSLLALPSCGLSVLLAELALAQLQDARLPEEGTMKHLTE